MLKVVVVVGSTNPAKIKPVKEFFLKHFKNVEVTGIKVSSGVSEQPLSDDETYTGAVNRARRALESVKNADFGVGVEGGLHNYSYGWHERMHVVIIDKNGVLGIGTSSGMIVPPKIMRLIQQGLSLGDAADAVFGTSKIGEGIGIFGLMTKEVVTRSSSIEHGLAFAYSRFLHKELFNE